MRSYTIIAVLATLAFVSSAQGACSQNEVFLVNRNLCAAKCTATSTTCGGGTCQGTSCACDEGYQNTASGALCVPICVKGCMAAGGLCNAPGVCDCADPTQYYDATTKKCAAKAECEGDCTGKICDATKCECAPGYELKDGKCEPTCAGKCDAAKGQACVAPGVCTCEDSTKNMNAQGECAVVTFVTTPAATTPAGGEDTTPDEGEETTPAEGEETTPAEETTPVEGEETTPAEGEETTPAEGEETTPAEGEETTPTDGEETTPAEGEETTPAEGEETTPAEGEETTPAEGEETTPAEGEETTPAPACDICAKLDAIEAQNKEILEKLI